MKRVVLLLAIIVVFAACKTAPTDIPDDLSQAELIQLAQESSDSDNWDAALAYYQAVLDRFPQDQGATVTAQYEMGFIEYKRGNNAEAQAIFEQLLGLYDFQGETLPQWPRVLAERLLAEISAESVTTAEE
jgi:outer membrane protein assembly factor BamD (BamD/ComL family)